MGHNGPGRGHGRRGQSLLCLPGRNPGNRRDERGHHGRPVRGGPEDGDFGLTPALEACVRQLGEYFAGQRKTFTVPLRPRGTDFQRRVWGALAEIPYGATSTYADIARTVGRPAAVRAVGSANGRNPVSILIPCHRVIGGDGRLVGYGGGLWRKAWLLAHERKFARAGGVLFRE